MGTVVMAEPLSVQQLASPHGRPVAYGYVRVAEPDDEVAGLRQAIAEHCQANGWRLVTTFCDRGYDGSELARPGFSALLDVLALTESTHLVVPELDHLSGDKTVRSGLVRQVGRRGITLVVACRQTDGPGEVRHDEPVG
jgi:DNA invertase Pin-like site-specific DNA recombinase